MRRWYSPARAALLVAGLAVGVSVPLVASSTTSAGAALRPVAGCPFHVGDATEEGAAGTLFYTVQLVPDNPAQRCTIAVTLTTTVRATGAAYTNIANNPLTSVQTVTFAPGRLAPVVAVSWGGLHCADPVGPGSILLDVGGDVTTFPVAPSTCGGEPGSALEPFPVFQPSAVGLAPTLDEHGYRVVDEAGVLTPEGNATAFTSAASSAHVVAVQAAPGGNGVWTAAADGGVFAYGSAAFHGSLGNLHLNAPVVGMAATPDGDGYWLVASDGGVFSFGNAGFHGSLGNLHLNAPVVGMAATPSGHGYWLVASDGGVFAFGDAAFAGSMGAVLLNAPVVGIAASPLGGYWLAASDGGIFTFGGVPFEGTADGPVRGPWSAITATASGHGYWFVNSDGTVEGFGDAETFDTCHC